MLVNPLTKGFMPIVFKGHVENIGVLSVFGCTWLVRVFYDYLILYLISF